MAAGGSCKDRGRSRLWDRVFLRICLLMGFETFVFVVFSLSVAHWLGRGARWCCVVFEIAVPPC